MAATTNEPHFYTTRDVAQILDRAMRTIEHWRYNAKKSEDPSKTPPYITLNGRVLYPVDEFWAWVEEQSEHNVTGGKNDATG